MEIVPLAQALGAGIRGVDVRSLGDAGSAALHAAWLDHCVLRLRAEAPSTPARGA